jgi:DNA-binding PucR family transcriptional regulator
VDLGPPTTLLGAVPPRSPRCEALITRIASRIDGHTDAIAERLVERIASEMGTIRDDEDIREDLLGVSRACAALLTAMTRSWSDPYLVPPPQDALEWSRSLVARGLPMDALLRSFRLGQSGYRDVWHRELAASGEEPEIVYEALRATSAFTFVWVDAILAPISAAYEDERERTMRGAHAVRAETLEAILSGRPVDVQRAAARLGYDLDRPHLAYVVWLESDAGESARDAIEELAATLASALAPDAPTRPLLLRVAPRLVFAWVARGQSGPAELATARALLRATEAHVALGRAATGLAGFRSSHHEARRARRVARLLRRSPPITRYEDVAVTDLLTRDPLAAREVARATLGPLSSDDDASRRLLATLRVFLQEGQSFARTARRLGIHENTVSYRVRRAVELTGQPDAQSLVLRAAIELVPLLDDDEHDEDDEPPLIPPPRLPPAGEHRG